MTNKDWDGDYRSTYTCLGASNHSLTDREENDYYATDPIAIDCLLAGGAKLSHNLWECACGEGHLSKRLAKYGYIVKSTDLIERGFGGGGTDFLQCSSVFDGDIITNPPYKYAQEFVEHALNIIPEGHRVFMFLKLSFMEGKARRNLFDKKQLKTVYVFSGRIKCGKNGRFDDIGSAVAYAWFEFEKGYNQLPTIK